MAPEFRFECKFCSQAIFAPYSVMGKKIHCPSCKNLVTVPIQTASMAQQPKGAQPQTARMQQQTRPAKAPESVEPEIPIHPVIPKKEPGKRAIQVRYKWEWLKKLVKLAIFAAIALGGYRLYQHYEQQTKKNMDTLIQEFGEGLAGNDFLIKQRLTKDDYYILTTHANSSSKDVRALMAECLGNLKLEKGLEPLGRLVKDKEASVRKAAAGALSNLRYRQSVEMLINRLDQETDAEVKGEIGYSLRELTGERPSAGKDDFWKIWWKKEGHRFKIKPE